MVSLLFIGLFLILGFFLFKYHGLITVFTWYDKTYGIHQVNRIDFSVFAKYHMPFNSWNMRKFVIELFNLNKENNMQRFYSTMAKHFPKNTKFVIRRVKPNIDTTKTSFNVEVDVYKNVDGEFVLQGTIKTEMCKRLSRKWLGWKNSITFYSNIWNLPVIIN